MTNEPLVLGVNSTQDASACLKFGNLAAYEQEIGGSLRLAPGPRIQRISPRPPFADTAVMIVDGQGSAVSSFTEHWDGAAEVPGHWREVSSFYRADRKRLDCIGKQLWDCDNGHLAGLGMFYFLLTQAIFPGGPATSSGGRPAAAASPCGASPMTSPSREMSLTVFRHHDQGLNRTALPGSNETGTA